MDDIRELVRTIVQQCASRGVSVPEVLAAFVARTVIEKKTSRKESQPGVLEQSLTQEGLNDLVDRSVDRLLEVDSPSLETMKMQVAFDSSYITEEEKLVKYYQRRDARLREMQRTIATMRPKDGADFDALTALHRQIFTYLLRQASDESRVGRGVEREVAAALESVFPRISLKAFINLAADEKYAQLDELANIVLGIRVFNQHIGKGGGNMPNPEVEATARLRAMGVALCEELEKTQETCVQLQQLIVRSHLRHPQGVTIDMLSRWKDELTNRRQYLSYLQSLQEDLAVSDRKVASLRESITSEMNDLQELVGNRASVPKEHVYPKFYEIAAQWTALLHEFKVVLGRTRTTEILRTFCNSYTPSFRSGMELQAGGDMTALDEEALAAEAAVDVTNTMEADGGSMELAQTGQSSDQVGENDVQKGADRNTAASSGHEMWHGEQSVSGASHSPSDNLPTERPVKLSIESTPEFMQLPLEYQGFCSWTIVKRQGLLLPGKPELGVIRYRNKFFVFAHQVAISSFINDPDVYIEGALDRAVRSPELIHLLRLQDSFPEACITRMLQGGKDWTRRRTLPLAAAEKREVSTETPTHFVESSMDSGYHWNEWVLRRRALQIANIRNCTTKSQQTDASNFRRANTTQVYPKRTGKTQTNRTSGSKPPQTVQYFAGLMGSSQSDAAGHGSVKHGRPSLINFTFEF